MLRFCLVGAGRIGRIHAKNIAGESAATLSCVVDPDQSAAGVLAEAHGARAVEDLSQALEKEPFDAVLIASPTDTHVELIESSAAAGKSIFCEKPIDLDLDRVDAAAAAVERANVPFFVGFNRRFDPSFRRLRQRITDGVIGNVEMISIISRDPAPPPLPYLKVSGGLFKDMMIHDFDMARWLLDEEPVTVFASASNLVDPAIGQIGDVDTALVILKTASGRLCQISNSRRAVYGYDQRIEVLGSEGMLQADNPSGTTLSSWTRESVQRDKPPHFFLERYAEAYRAELAHFVDAVSLGKPLFTGWSDGRQALRLAEAALAASQSHQAVEIPPSDGS